MIDLKFIDEITRRLSEALPPGINQAREDFETQIRSVLSGAFERMDLVTREQFDAQCKSLDRAREKLEELEAQIAELNAHS